MTHEIVEGLDLDRHMLIMSKNKFLSVTERYNLHQTGPNRKNFNVAMCTCFCYISPSQRSLNTNFFTL